MSKVVHCKKEKYDIYIGRYKEGQNNWYANPFQIEKHGFTRERAIELFEWYFYASMDMNYFNIKDILAMKGKVLGCWCKPSPCHGDIILDFLTKVEGMAFEEIKIFVKKENERLEKGLSLETPKPEEKDQKQIRSFSERDKLVMDRWIELNFDGAGADDARRLHERFTKIFNLTWLESGFLEDPFQELVLEEYGF